MKPTTIDYEYYEWLISHIDIPNHKSFNDLFEQLHNTEFVWTVPNDDNRIEDGLDLRYLFLDGRRKNLALNGATFLEVLVSLSERVEFTAGGRAPLWAWKLLKNLGLTKMFDPLTRDQHEQVADILDAVIWRTYQPNGVGGFFPLNYPEEDQTQMEIWHQMNKYVIERNLI